MVTRLKLLLYHFLFNRIFLRRNVQERMSRHLFFSHAFFALSFNGIDGDYVEFGCYSGTTFSLAYSEARRWGHSATLWAFDSFKGLPDDDIDRHPGWTKGSMATSVSEFHSICAAHNIPRRAYKVVKGVFEETLPRMSPGEGPTNIALAYIDCDLYSSSTIVLDFLQPRIKHGMIVAFDDYFIWSATQRSGERQAFLEKFSQDEHWHFLPYRTFGMSGMSFVVEDKALIAKASDAPEFYAQGDRN